MWSTARTCDIDIDTCRTVGTLWKIYRGTDRNIHLGVYIPTRESCAPARSSGPGRSIWRALLFMMLCIYFCARAQPGQVLSPLVVAPHPITSDGDKMIDMPLFGNDVRCSTTESLVSDLAACRYYTTSYTAPAGWSGLVFDRAAPSVAGDTLH